MPVNEQVIIELVARTEAAEKQIAKLTEQLNKTKVAAKKASEDGIERLVKNGGAMAILNDLTGGLAMQFKDAYESIQLTNTGLKGMKAALIATGIGAAVVAIGLLVSNWESVDKWIRSVNTGLETQIKLAGIAVEESKKQLAEYTLQENMLRLQGVTEKELAVLRQQKLKDLITEQEREIELLKIQRDKLALADSEALVRSQYLGPLGQLYYSAVSNAAQLDEITASINQKEEDLLKAKSDEAGIQLQLMALDKERESLLATQGKERRDREKEALKAREKDEIDSIDRITQKQRDALAERQRMLEEAEHIAAATRMKGVEDVSKQVEKDRKEQRQRDQDEANYKAQLQQSSFALANSLNDLLFSKQGEQSRAGFRIAKALGVAEAGVNTYKAASAAYATASASPYAILNPAYPSIMAGIAVAFGVAQVAKIAATQYGGGAASGGQGSAPNIPGSGAPTPTNPQAALDFSFLNQQQPVQTYVIAGDVTNAQEANQKLKDQSAL